MGSVLEVDPLVICMLCAPAASDTRSGVVPRAMPSIAIEAPSGTELMTAVPVCTTGAGGDSAVVRAFHVCQPSHENGTANETAATAKATALSGIRRPAGWTRGLPGSRLSDLKETSESSFSPCPPSKLHWGSDVEPRSGLGRMAIGATSGLSTSAMFFRFDIDSVVNIREWSGKDFPRADFCLRLDREMARAKLHETQQFDAIEPAGALPADSCRRCNGLNGRRKPSHVKRIDEFLEFGM
jgi:hypothetical protein